MKIGDFVISKRGRDQDKIFVVVRMDDIYVWLCDGNLRKQDKPKMKKQKHVKETGYSDSMLCEKMAEGKCANADFRKAILRFLNQENSVKED